MRDTCESQFETYGSNMLLNSSKAPQINQGKLGDHLGPISGVRDPFRGSKTNFRPFLGQILIIPDYFRPFKSLFYEAKSHFLQKGPFPKHNFGWNFVCGPQKTSQIWTPKLAKGDVRVQKFCLSGWGCHYSDKNWNNSFSTTLVCIVTRYCSLHACIKIMQRYLEPQFYSFHQSVHFLCLTL